MRLLLFDVAVNIALLIADAAALFLLWKKREIRWFVAAIVGYGAAVAFGLVLSVAVVGLFGAMRALAWVLFLHAVFALAGAAALLWKPYRRAAAGAAVVALLIAVVGADAFFIEPFRLEVSRVRLASSKVTRPLRIAIVADLQTDVIGDYERAALRRVAEEKPDLVLFAGDYLQEHDDSRRRKLIRELREIVRGMGPAAAIAVEGNCDSPDWPAIFEGTGVKIALETRAIREGDLQVTALGLDDSFDTRLDVRPADAFHIVVGHAPDFALGNVEADLLVAGHTHGGQVRLPFIGPLLTLSSVPRSWAAGVTTLSGDRTLIVSRGIGMERGPAPRLRFLCRPEIVIVELTPQ